jgi:hypothetical protein
MTDADAARLDTDVYLTDFLAAWDDWTDDRGYTLPLPDGWRTRVIGLSSLGVTDEEWRYAIGQAVHRRSSLNHYDDGAVFRYATGVAWNRLGTALGHDPSYRNSIMADPEKAERVRVEEQRRAEEQEQRRAEEHRRREEYRREHRCEEPDCAQWKATGEAKCAFHLGRICGRPKRDGEPCRQQVRRPGDACSHHRARLALIQGDAAVDEVHQGDPEDAS